MKHLFASGEHIYFKNVKQLEQGKLVVDHLIYDEIKENTLFEAVGTLEGNPVSVLFKIKGEAFADIKFKHTVKILMQSDLILVQWDYYEIKNAG
ncbi:MAG: hypothetical protein Q8920_12330 [Bacillota bacterium]|nr:hypothetical protein [Bacillota bacterium]